MHGDGLFRIYDLITLRRSEIEEWLSNFKENWRLGKEGDAGLRTKSLNY